MEFDFPLPERWKWVPLGELADPTGRAIVSGPFGSNISSKFFVEEGIPVIRGNNLTTGAQKFIDNGFVFVTPEKAKELGNVDAICDDLVFTAAGSLGQVGIIPERTRFNTYIISNKQMRVRLNRELIHPLFAFQWLSSSPMVEFIQRQNTGSSVPLINLSIIRRLPVPLPPLPEQRAIAAVLGALDDKIELNRRMNATLESMARALFQSWFVDFDPVRAKLDPPAAHHPPALDPATAALFPEHMEDSPLGQIPRGWEICALADKIELLSGGTPKTSEPDYWDGDIPWYSVKDAPSETDVWAIQTEKHVTTLGIQNSAAQVLPVGTTIISARGTVGKLALVGKSMAMNQSCYGVRGAKGYADYFTYFALRQATADLQQRTHGTVFDTITRQTFETLACVFPPGQLTQVFDRTTAPLLIQIRKNLQQSRTLAALRDTLLPKLLSGELSVAGAAHAMEQA